MSIFPIRVLAGEWRLRRVGVGRRDRGGIGQQDRLRVARGARGTRGELATPRGETRPRGREPEELLQPREIALGYRSPADFEEDAIGEHCSVR